MLKKSNKMIVDRKIQPKSSVLEHFDLVKVKPVSLGNGLVVNVVDTAEQEFCKLEMLFNAGAKYQQKKLSASIMVDMLFEGTVDLSSKEVAEKLDYYGAFYDASSNGDIISIQLYCPNKYFSEVLPLFTEVIFTASFPEEEFLIIKEQAFQRFKISNERVSYLANKTFFATIFEGNTYGDMPVEEDFERISREDVVAHYQSYVKLGNGDVILSGRVTEKELAVVAACLEGREVVAPSEGVEFLQKDFKKGNLLVEKEGAVQSAILIGMPMFTKHHADYFGVQFLSTILGGYFGSRLMKNIREDKGYTYGIGSGLRCNQDAGYFYITTEVGADVCEKALGEIYKEIEKLKTELIPQEEIELVRNYLKGLFLRGWDGPFSIADRFKDIQLFGLDYNYFDHYLSSLNTINSVDLQRLAQKYFCKEKMVEVVAGKA